MPRSSAINDFLLRRCWQCKPEGCPSRFIRFGAHPAPVSFDYAPADRETNPHTGILGSVKWLKQIGQDSIGKSYTGIRYDDLDQIADDPRIRNNDFTFRSLRHRLRCVAKQVDKDLLDLNAIGENQIVR